MISKVELWVNNDSTGIQDLTPPFSIIWNTKDYKNSSYDIFIRSYDMQGKSLIVGPLQSQLVIFWSSLKHLVSMEKVN